MTDLVTILSSVCGHHFDDDCQACASAKESNDRRLEALSERIAVLERENAALREKRRMKIVPADPIVFEDDSTSLTPDLSQ